MVTLPQCNAAWHVVYLRLIQYIVWSLFHCTNIPRHLKALDKKPQIFCCWFYLLCGAIYCTWKKLAANCLVMVPQGTGSLTFSTLKVKAWLWCHCARVPKCLVCLRKKVTMPQGTCSYKCSAPEMNAAERLVLMSLCMCRHFVYLRYKPFVVG